MLSEFLPLPSRLASSPLYQAVSVTADDVMMSTHRRGDGQLSTSAAAAASAVGSDHVVAVPRHQTTYYNNWKSSHHARERSLVHSAAGLNGHQRSSTGYERRCNRSCAELLTLERPGICPYLERPLWVIFDPCTKGY